MIKNGADLEAKNNQKKTAADILLER